MTLAAPVTQDGRLRHVDALRAIAALLVVWRHVVDAFLTLGPGVGGAWLAQLAGTLDTGRIGVVTFFLLSGYVIPYSIRPQRAAPVATFLIRRFFRIFPAYWLSVPLGAVTTYWIWGQSFSAGELLVNLTLLQSFFGIRDAIGLYWTLVAEWSFYVLCVLLLVSGSFDRPRRWLLLAIVFALVFLLEMFGRWRLGGSWLSTSVAFAFLNLSVMVLGALFRRVVVERDAREDRWLRLGTFGLLAGLLVVLPLAATWALGTGRHALTSYALGLLLFIAGIRVVRIRSRVTDWLGQVSYSIYLFHPVVFMSLLWLLMRLPPASPLRSLHLGTYLAVNVLLTVALATVIYRLVERPGIELGRRLARRWVARVGAMPADPSVDGANRP